MARYGLFEPLHPKKGSILQYAADWVDEFAIKQTNHFNSFVVCLGVDWVLTINNHGQIQVIWTLAPQKGVNSAIRCWVDEPALNKQIRLIHL